MSKNVLQGGDFGLDFYPRTEISAQFFTPGGPNFRLGQERKIIETPITNHNILIFMEKD